MNIVPLNEHVVVRMAEAAERTAGGILLPDAAREKPQQGRVIAVGDGLRINGSSDRAPFQVKEGDRVVFHRYGGTPVRVNNEDLLILSEAEILAVVG
jgi:chaperonin GroES